MANFYLREDLDDVDVGDEVELGASEARHIATVSRTRAGERILFGNGRGLRVSGTVISAAPELVVVRAESVDTSVRASPRITLVQALAKGGRDELAVQAATELGADAVIPWSADRSVTRWEGQKVAKGNQRWATIAREAAKQSMRTWLPEVLPLASTRDLVELAADVRMLVLDPTADVALWSPDTALDGPALTLVVGPEGGISPAELDALCAAGAQQVRLGGAVLRTSTAGPAALAVINTLRKRW